MLRALVALVLVTAGFAQRPNILWITCEDISPHLGCYGDPTAVTPNIDRLAKQGVLYRNAFAPIGVCAPARSCLITGMYPNSIGSQHMRCKAPLPRGVKTYPEYLRAAGYYCTNNSKTDYNLDVRGRKIWDESSRKAHWRNRKDGQPFFAIFNYTSCHESQIRLPERRYKQRVAKFEKHELHDPAKVAVPPYHPDTPEVRKDWARYADMITFMDKQVGRVLRQLKEDGLDEDTIVFYYSDHGAGMPRSKRWLYDSSMRVPLILRVPKKFQKLAPGAAGTETRRLVSFVDFASTVLALAGVEVPAHMQGRAFLGADTKPRQHVFGFRDRMDERYDMIRCVTDGRYKLIRNYMPHHEYAQHIDYMYQMPTMRVWRQRFRAGQLDRKQAAFFRPKPSVEFYDTQADPHEVNNLANNADLAQRRGALAAALDAWMLRIRDVGFLPEGDLRTRFGKGSPYDAVRGGAAYPFEKLQAAAKLASSRSISAIPRLRDLAIHADPAVRYWAAQGFAALGGGAAAAVGDLHLLLKDKAGDVRVVAADALCRLGGREAALPVLQRALRDKNVWVQLRAANALDRLDQVARPALEAMRALKPKDKYLQRVLNKALRDLK